MEKPHRKPWIPTDLQSRRAFWISLINTVLMALSLVIFQFTGAGLEVQGIFNTRFFVGVVAITSLVSWLWLSRSGHGQLGVSLINASFQVAVLFVALTVSGLGPAAGVLVLVVTLSLTSALFKTRWTSIEITVGVVLAVICVLMDLFTPYPRVPLKTPELIGVMTPILAIIFAGLIIWQFNTYGLRAKLMITMVAMAIIAAAVLTFFYNRMATQSLTKGINQQLTGNAEMQGGQISYALDEEISIITTLSLNNGIQQAAMEHVGGYSSSDEAAILAEIEARDRAWVAAGAGDAFVREHLSNSTAHELMKFQEKFPENVEVFVTDRYGALVGTTNRTSDYNQADEGWWQAAYNQGQGDVYISGQPEYDESTGTFSLLIALPIRDPATGKITGVLRTTYVLKSLSSLLSSSKIGETGEVDMFFPGDSPLRIHEMVLEKVDPGQMQEMNAIIDGNITRLVYEGTDRMVGFARIKSLRGTPAIDRLGWVVIMHQDASEALIPVQSQTNFSLIITLAIVALASLLALALSLVLVRPIRRLTSAAEKVGGGDLTARAAIESSDEVGRLATTFNSMTDQLQSTLQGLEQRVADRTRALTTSSEVSRRISTILNQKDLVTEVVEQVKSAFNYYHVHIYLFDEKQENLVMVGGTGEAGQIMLSQKHHISRGRGLVGHAAESNTIVLVGETSQDSNWLPNPLLPETKSEVAVPISIGKQVLGVLDVQHNIIDGLKYQDAEMLQSISNQVAIALQNIRQFQNTQKMATDLGVVANVGIATSTITDIDRLLQEVVDLSKKSFNLYHAHIYLLNDAGDTLELAAGAGEVGRQMVAEGRSIPLDSEKSLVARAARNHVGVVANDVSADPEFLPHPLLPDTRSELAVPMIVAGKVIGVLDVQSELIGRFTDVDVNIHTTLASQVAVALQNARSFLRAQQQAERESVLNIITRKIQGTTTLDAALKIAARELGHALGMKPTRIELNPAALADQQKPAPTE